MFNNNKLNNLCISDNLYNSNLVVYKNNNINVDNNVILPNNLDWDNPIWTSKNTNIAVVDENGRITAVDSGEVNIVGVVDGKYVINNKVNVVEITSNKYVINETKKYIYVGFINDIDNINKNINVSHKDVFIDVDKDNDKLYVKYDEDILNIFDIVKIDLSNFNILDNSISLNGVIEYEEFIKNLKFIDGVTYKILDENIEIDNGIIDNNMVLKIYYLGMEVDSYDILNDYLIFKDSIVINEDGKYISNIGVGSKVQDVLDMINTSGSIYFYDNDGNEVSDGNIGTGYKISINLREKKYVYNILVCGDVDGDGKLKLSDIMKIANYLYKDKSSLIDIYELAADFDNNNKIELSDIMKIAKKIYN